MIAFALLLIGAAPPLDEPLPPGCVARLGTAKFNSFHGPTDILFTPGGRLVLVDWGGVTLWDAGRGRRVGRIRLRDEEHGPRFFLPHPRGGPALVDDVGLRVVDPGTGKELWKDEEAFPRALAYGHDGSWFAWTDDDAATHVGDARTGKETRRISPPPTPDDSHPPFLQMAACPTRPEVALFTGDGAVSVWHKDGKAPLWRAAGHMPANRYQSCGRAGEGAIAYHPGGEWLATGGRDGTLRLWHARTGRPGRVLALAGPVNFLAPDRRVCHALAISKSGLLAASLTDGSIRIHDTAAGKELHVIRSAHPPDRMAFAPDGHTLATADEFRPHVALWDARTGKRLHEPEGHLDEVQHLRVLPDGSIASLDTNVGLLWSPTAGKVEAATREFQRLFHPPVTSPDGKQIIEVKGDDIRVVVAASGKVSAEWKAGGQPITYWFTSDGKGIVAFVAGGLPSARLAGWTLGGKELFKSVEGSTRHDRIWKSPDGGRCLYMGMFSTAVNLLDCKTGRTAKVFDFGADLGPRPWERGDVVWSPDGSRVAMIDGRVTLLDTRTWVPALSFDPAGAVIEFSPDGRLLASRAENAVRLHETASGRLVRELSGPMKSPGLVAFSPDGRTLAASSWGAMIHVWDVTGTLHSGRPDAAALARCWGRLAGEAPDAHVAVWQIADTPGGVPQLARHLDAQKAPEAAALKRLLGELDSDDFETRDRAEAGLVKLGPSVSTALRKHLSSKPSQEVMKRLERVLTAIRHSPESLRLSRAVMALEKAGTPEARALLKRLAGGDADAPLTREAKAALSRIDTPKE